MYPKDVFIGSGWLSEAVRPDDLGWLLVLFLEGGCAGLLALRRLSPLLATRGPLESGARALSRSSVFLDAFVSLPAPAARASERISASSSSMQAPRFNPRGKTMAP